MCRALQTHPDSLRQEIEKRKRTLQCARPWKTPEDLVSDADADTQPASLSPVAKSLQMAFKLDCKEPDEGVGPSPCQTLQASPSPVLPAPLANQEEPEPVALPPPVAVSKKQEESSCEAPAAESQEASKAVEGVELDDLFHVPPPTSFCTREQQFTNFDAGTDPKEEEEFHMDDEAPSKKPKAKAKAKGKPKAKAKAGRPKAKAKAGRPKAKQGKSKGEAQSKGKSKGNAQGEGASKV